MKLHNSIFLWFIICKWPWDSGGLFSTVNVWKHIKELYWSISLPSNLKIYHHPYWLFNFDLSFCRVQCMPWNRDACLYWTEIINLSLCLPLPPHPTTMKCVHSWQLLISQLSALVWHVPYDISGWSDELFSGVT